MARAVNRLTPKGVASQRKPGYYGDGLGLWLQVSKAATKSWLFRYMLNGKAREMGLGACHTVSLGEARAAAAEQRKLLLQRKDPIEVRDAVRATESNNAKKIPTFDECSKLYIESHRAGWKNKKHAEQWTNTLEKYASPVFGALPVNAIGTHHIIRALETDGLWTEKTETATRVRGRIEKILDWATVRDFRSGENPARWRGHLESQLPKPSKVAKVTHHRALPINGVGKFMAALRKRKGYSTRALEFAILTAARSGEVRGATWAEIDLKNAVWIVPGQRMKMGKEHKVPLSPAALKLLKALPRMGSLVFPAPRGGELSDMALAAVVRKIGSACVPHGFRSTFRDWCSECTNYPRDATEMALAHAIGDKVEAAYRRGDLFEKHRQMMDDWAEFCSVVVEDPEKGGA